MREELIEAFPSLAEKELSDEYIKGHPDLMWSLPVIPLNRAVPLYMLWCIDHASEEGELVFDNTISALNKYSRAKDLTNKSQDFLFTINDAQVVVVRDFLKWCKEKLMLDYEPSLSRALKNWQAVNKAHQNDLQ